MKKVLFFTMIFVLAITAIGSCAVPDPNAGIGSIQIGHNYYRMEGSNSGVSRDDLGFNEIYGSVGIGFGYGGFVSRFHGDGMTYTDFGLSVKPLIPNFALLVGQRRMEYDYADNDNELFYGASFKQELPGGLAAYATYQKGSHFKDAVVGVTYDMTDNIQLDLSWKRFDDKYDTTYKGIGGGLNIKF